jgi:hypothetical protein
VRPRRGLRGELGRLIACIYDTAAAKLHAASSFAQVWGPEAAELGG